MKHIFAIPIYVLSKEHLSRKVKQKERAIREKNECILSRRFKIYESYYIRGMYSYEYMGI